MKKLLLLVSGLALVGCKQAADKPEGEASRKATSGSAEPAKVDPKPDPKKDAKAGTPEAKLARYLECWDAFNAGKDDVYTGCFAGDAVKEQVDGVPDVRVEGPDKILELAKQQKAAFPDLKVTPQIVVINGGDIAAILHVTGTNTGAAGGIKATKSKVSMLEAQVASMGDDGLFSHDALYVDQLTIFHQLGLLENDSSPASEASLGAPKHLLTPENKANKAVIEKHIEAVNQKDAKTLESLAADDIKLVDHGDRQKTEGKKAYAKWVKETLATTNDGKLEIKGIWAVGDFVAVADVFTGTPAKDIPGVKGAKEKHIETRLVHFYQVVDGKIKQHHIFKNHLKTAVQLGMVDPQQLGEMLGGGDEGAKRPGK